MNKLEEQFTCLRVDVKQVIDSSKSEAVDNTSKFKTQSKRDRINSDDPFGDGLDDMNNLSYSETVGEMKKELETIKEILSALCGDVEYLMSEGLQGQTSK